MKSNLFTRLLDALFPKKIKCILCGDELNGDAINNVCAHCHKHAPFISGHTCVRCDMPLNADDYSNVCFNCKQHDYHFTAMRAVFAYKGGVRSCVYRLKYKHQAFLAEYLSKFMVNKYATFDWKIDAVIAIPLHPKRLKSRGYNQSMLLAQPFCEQLHLPLLDVMTRVKDTPSQTRFGSRDRTKNMKDCFDITDKSAIKDKTILLIDDVYTTGTTIEEAARLLLSAGAKEVYALTLAHAVIKKKL